LEDQRGARTHGWKKGWGEDYGANPVKDRLGASSSKRRKPGQGSSHRGGIAIESQTIGDCRRNHLGGAGNRFWRGKEEDDTTGDASRGKTGKVKKRETEGKLPSILGSSFVLGCCLDQKDELSKFGSVSWL